MTAVLVLVTGPPASGKTTLARPLAAALGRPLIGKDLINEALFDALEVATWVRASLPIWKLPDNH